MSVLRVAGESQQRDLGRQSDWLPGHHLRQHWPPHLRWPGGYDNHTRTPVPLDLLQHCGYEAERWKSVKIKVCP